MPWSTSAGAAPLEPIIPKIVAIFVVAIDAEGLSRRGRQPVDHLGAMGQSADPADGRATSCRGAEQERA